MKEVLTNIWKCALWLFLALIARWLVVEINGNGYDSGLFVGLSWYFLYDRIFHAERFKERHRKKVAKKDSNAVSNA